MNQSHMKKITLAVYIKGKNRQDSVTMEIITSGCISRWRVRGLGGSVMYLPWNIQEESILKRESITYSPKDKEKCDSKTTWGHTGLVPRKKHRLRPLFCGFPGKGLQQGREVKRVYNWIFLCMLRIEACMHVPVPLFFLVHTWEAGRQAWVSSSRTSSSSFEKEFPIGLELIN